MAVVLVGAPAQERDGPPGDQIADLGVTGEHGYPVQVSRHVTDADLTVYVNTNYIRGFTGGWKSVCIGLSTWASIRVTHNPDGMSMSLSRNRMHAVLDEMGRFEESDALHEAAVRTLRAG